MNQQQSVHLTPIQVKRISDFALRRGIKFFADATSQYIEHVESLAFAADSTRKFVLDPSLMAKLPKEAFNVPRKVREPGM